MGRLFVRLPALAYLFATLACAGTTGSEGAGGAATATIDGTRFEVSDVHLVYDIGEDGYFRIAGDDSAHPREDCLPGLQGGLALYGDWPADAGSLADLAGRDLPFEFSGDGDEFNLCFVGSNGLLGVEQGTVHIASVNGDAITFSFTGDFTRYDGEGGESAGTAASGGGIARVRDE